MKFKIVLVSFPFDDFTGTKLRPALCLTNSTTFYKHVVIAFITSNLLNATEASDVVITTTDTNFDQTGLKANCSIRLHRLISLPQSIFLRTLGELPKNFHSKVEQKLIQLFSLDHNFFNG